MLRGFWSLKLKYWVDFFETFEIEKTERDYDNFAEDLIMFFVSLQNLQAAVTFTEVCMT